MNERTATVHFLWSAGFGQCSNCCLCYHHGQWLCTRILGFTRAVGVANKDRRIDQHKTRQERRNCLAASNRISHPCLFHTISIRYNPQFLGCVISEQRSFYRATLPTTTHIMPSHHLNDEAAVAAADKEMEERANRAKELLSKRYHGLKRHQVCMIGSLLDSCGNSVSPKHRLFGITVTD